MKTKIDNLIHIAALKSLFNIKPAGGENIDGRVHAIYEGDLPDYDKIKITGELSNETVSIPLDFFAANLTATKILVMNRKKNYEKEK